MFVWETLTSELTSINNVALRVQITHDGSSEVFSVSVMWYKYPTFATVSSDWRKRKQEVLFIRNNKRNLTHEHVSAKAKTWWDVLVLRNVLFFLVFVCDRLGVPSSVLLVYCKKGISVCDECDACKGAEMGDKGKQKVSPLFAFSVCKLFTRTSNHCALMGTVVRMRTARSERWQRWRDKELTLHFVFFSSFTECTSTGVLRIVYGCIQCVVNTENSCHYGWTVTNDHFRSRVIDRKGKRRNERPIRRLRRNARRPRMRRRRRRRRRMTERRRRKRKRRRRRKRQGRRGTGRRRRLGMLN